MTPNPQKNHEYQIHEYYNLRVQLNMYVDNANVVKMHAYYESEPGDTGLSVN